MKRNTTALALASVMALGAGAAYAQEADGVTCAQFRTLSEDQQGEIVGNDPNIAAVNQFCDENPDGMAMDAMADGMETGEGSVAGDPDASTSSMADDGDFGSGTVASDPVTSGDGVDPATNVTNQPEGTNDPGTVGTGTVASPDSDQDGPDTTD